MQSQPEMQNILVSGLIKKAKETTISDPKLTISICDSGLDLTDKNTSISDYVELLLLKGYGHYLLNDLATSQLIYKEAINLSTEAQDNHLLSKSYIRYVATITRTSKPDDVLALLDKAKSIDPNYPRFEYYKTLGATYSLEKNAEESLYYTRKALDYIDENDQNATILYFNISSILHALERHQEAFDYLTKAEELALRYNIPRLLIFIYGSISEHKLRLGEVDKAIEFQQKVSDIIEEAKFEYLKVESHIDFADLYLNNGDLDKAEEYIDEALKIADKEDFTICNIAMQIKIKISKAQEDAPKIRESRDQYITFLEKKILNLKAASKLQNLRVKENEVKTLLENRNLIKEKNLRLRQQNADLLQFSFISANDLKEPAQKIGAFSAQLENNYKENLPNEGKEFIELISSNTQRLNAQLDNLIQYTSIELNEHKGDLVSFRSLCEELINPLKQYIKYLKVQLFIEDDGIPIYCNSQLLKVALSQLIENAIKFKSVVPLEVTISCKSNQSETIISVKDNGIGIAEEYHDRIFKIFKRLDKSNEGTGIGLALVKKIAQKHSGKTWLESKKNTGSTFFIKLPIPQIA